MASGGTTVATGDNAARRRQWTHNNDKGQHGNMQHDDGDRRQDVGDRRQHGDVKGQQGERRYDNGTGNGRHDEAV
jgi:hypothetical protein